jgi:hypothetical protein
MKRLRLSTSLRTPARSSNRSPVSPSGSATSRTLKPWLFGSPPTTNGAYFAPRKFGPPERDIDGMEKYAGSPAGAPFSAAVTDPMLGWKLTNAPHPTGMRGGAPVIM